MNSKKRSWLLAAWLVAAVTSCAQAQAIKIADVVSVWKETPIVEIQVEFELRTTETKLTSNAQSKGPISGVVQTESSSKVENGKFCRNALIGLRKASIERECNWIRGRGLSVDRVSLKNDGIYGVVTEADREATITTLHEVQLMLAWVDPLATSMFSRLKLDDDLDLRNFEDPVIGPVLQIEFRGERTFEWVLAKKFAWRPIEAREFLGNKLITQSEWNYQLDPSGRIKLVDSMLTSFRGSVTNEHMIRVGSVQNHCPEDQLAITLDGEYVLFDDSGKGRTYVVLSDGTKHVLTDEMRRGRKSWKEIFAWVRDNSPKSSIKQ